MYLLTHDNKSKYKGQKTITKSLHLFYNYVEINLIIN